MLLNHMEKLRLYRGFSPFRVISCTVNPNEVWMKQMACNLTDGEDGFLKHKSHLLMDRDTKFSEAFRSILEQSGIQLVRLPPKSPNCNVSVSGHHCRQWI